MHYFRVKLYAVGFFVAEPECGNGNALGGSLYNRIGRKPHDAVAMAHPNAAAHGYSLEQARTALEKVHMSTAVLAMGASGYFSAAGLGHKLGSVADSQQGNLSIKLR